MKKTKCLTREEIFRSNDLPRVRVETPLWGGHVYVQAMTSGEREVFEAQMIKKGKNTGDDNVEISLTGMRASLCVRTVVNTAGEKIFSDEKDVEKLAEKSAVTVNTLAMAALKQNAMTDQSVDDLAKNS